MRNPKLLALFLVASTAVAGEKTKPLAGSCTTRPIVGCDVDVPGTLESGDCLFSDGTRVDEWSFTGARGQIVEAVVRPLSTSYTRPWIALIPPSGDPADAPIVHGGSMAATVIFQLTSSGTWRIRVSSDDLFAGGSYVLHLFCYSDNNPDAPPGCVTQALVCGQTGEADLNADSCRFTSVPKAYQAWEFYGASGDVVTIEQTSVGFEPLFGLYQNGNLLRSSTRELSRKATMLHILPSSGWYTILTTTVESNIGGSLTVSLRCTGPGCVWPYVSPIQAQTVPYGRPATIGFAVNPALPFTATLRQDLATLATSTTTSITTPPITGRQMFVLDVDNACGGWTTEPFTVSPTTYPKRRAVRR